MRPNGRFEEYGFFWLHPSPSCRSGTHSNWQVKAAPSRHHVGARLIFGCMTLFEYGCRARRARISLGLQGFRADPQAPVGRERWRTLPHPTYKGTCVAGRIGHQVSARTAIRRRIATFLAMLALTYNIAASPLVQAHANALDAFGQPNCSEHANNAPGDRPDGPAGAIPRQFCCPLTAAATLDARRVGATSASNNAMAAGGDDVGCAAAPLTLYLYCLISARPSAVVIVQKSLDHVLFLRRS